MAVSVNRWRMKRLMMVPFAHARAGENLYEWLTAVLLGTQKGMSRKWCYWFREHVVLSRRYGRLDFAEKRLWLFEPGWSLAPVILGRLITRGDILATEDHARLADRYVPYAVDEVGKVEAVLRRSTGAGSGDLSLLEELCEETSARQVLSACRARYHVGDLGSLARIEPGSTDVCFSMGRLEHFTPEDLTFLMSQMFRILSPGGISSHIVDHRDHFWHYDKSIHCFHHLIYSDAEWASIARGRHMFRNRLLEGDYARMFEEQGFEVLAAVHHLHREDAQGVDPGSLWGRYSELRPADLEAAVTHFVVRRP